MAYNYEYPYTDPNRYNSDWLLHKMGELEGRLDGIVEETLNLTKDYVDERLVNVLEQITEVRNAIKNVEDSTNVLSEKLITEVVRIESLITDAEKNAENLFIIANNRTDLQIQRNNEYIFREIEDNILSNITVINYFTGERISVQNMFDYLASLHLQNSISYNGLIDKNLTYTELAAKNITYTELVKNGSVDL